MTCDEMIELLPWLLNGSLEGDEAARVRAHLSSCAPCREALAETRFAWRAFGEHVLPEDLVAWAYDDLPPGADPGLIERHVAACPQCAAELEMVRASRLLGEHEEVATLPVRRAAAPPRYRVWRSGALAAGLAGLIAAGGWLNSSGRVRSLEAELAAERSAPPAAMAPVAPADPGAAGRFADLEAKNRRLAEQLQELGRTQQQLQEQAASLERQAAQGAAGAAVGNAFIVDVFPPEGEVVRGGTGDAKPLAIPGTVQVVTLVLNSGVTRPGVLSYELLDGAGKVIHRGGGLVRNPETGALNLALSPSLARRSRTVRLLGEGGDPAQDFPLLGHD